MLDSDLNNNNLTISLILNKITFFLSFFSYPSNFNFSCYGRVCFTLQFCIVMNKQDNVFGFVKLKGGWILKRAHQHCSVTSRCGG